MSKAVIYGDSLLRGQESFVGETEPPTVVVCRPGLTIQRARQELASNLYNMLDDCHLLVLHVGTNDLSRRRGADAVRHVVNDLMELVEEFLLLFPRIRLVLSCPLPRNDRHAKKAYDSWKVMKVCLRQYPSVSLFRHASFLRRGQPHSGRAKEGLAKEGLLQRDGLHLTDQGKLQFGQHLRFELGKLHSPRFAQQS